MSDVKRIMVVGNSHIRRMESIASGVVFPSNLKVEYRGIGGGMEKVKKLFMDPPEDWIQPDAVIIAAMDNDINEKLHLPSYMASVTAFNTFLNTQGISLVYFCAPLLRNENTYNYDVYAYNSIVINIDKKRSRYSIYIIHAHIKKLQEYIKSDGVHLSNPGYHLYRKNIDDFIVNHIANRF